VHFFTFLKSKGKNIHRGALLEAAVKISPLSISELTKRMGISRSTFYNHKADPSLPIEWLIRYGRILKHDFSHEVAEVEQFSVSDPDNQYEPPKTFEEALIQRDYWRDKYYQLLEKFNKFILEKIPKIN
jgi:hypothetical protein